MLSRVFSGWDLDVDVTRVPSGTFARHNSGFRPAPAKGGSRVSNSGFQLDFFATIATALVIDLVPFGENA
jgi:hypothetical protein